MAFTSIEPKAFLPNLQAGPSKFSADLPLHASEMMVTNLLRIYILISHCDTPTLAVEVVPRSVKRHQSGWLISCMGQLTSTHSFLSRTLSRVRMPFRSPSYCKGRIARFRQLPERPAAAQWLATATRTRSGPSGSLAPCETRAASTLTRKDEAMLIDACTEINKYGTLLATAPSSYLPRPFLRALPNPIMDLRPSGPRGCSLP